MGNNNFSSSVSHAPLQKQMEAYDKLPPTIRRALQDAAFNYAAYPVRRYYENGGKPAVYWAKKIAQWDRDVIEKDRRRGRSA